jgi:hypothetical protein
LIRPSKYDEQEVKMPKIGFRVPSLNKRIAARTSVRRYLRNSLGLKAPRGYGWFTNPRRAAYNRIYNRTTKGCGFVLLLAISIGVLIKFLLT